MGMIYRQCIQSSHFNRCTDYEYGTGIYAHCRSEADYPVQLAGVCRLGVKFTDKQTCNMILSRIVMGRTDVRRRFSDYDEWIYECITWYLDNNERQRT